MDLAVVGRSGIKHLRIMWIKKSLKIPLSFWFRTEMVSGGWKRADSLGSDAVSSPFESTFQINTTVVMKAKVLLPFKFILCLSKAFA